MASEFTRKVQKIKDILTFNSILADDGDILLTKSGEVYTQVNGKVKQLSNPNYGAGNVNKILAVSGTGEVVPIQMPSAGDILGKDNTFTGINNFSKPINGPMSIRQIPSNTTSIKSIIDNFTSEVSNGAYGSVTYMGYNNNKLLTDSPFNSTYLLIKLYARAGRTYVEVSDESNNVAFSNYASGTFLPWRVYASSSEVLHNSGNETASGDKTFNGQTTLLNGNFGLRVTNTGIVKTTDAGNTWTAL